MIYSKAFSTKFNFRAVIISGLSLLIIFFVIQYTAAYFNKPERQVEGFQNNFLTQQKMLYDHMEIIEDILSTKRENYWPLLERAVEDHNVIAQLYLKDSLFYWNSRMVTNEIARVDAAITDTVIFQKTGWYLLHRKKVDDFDIFLLKQIKAEYAYNNSYLPNTIDPDFSTAENIELTHNLDGADFIIRDQNGKECLGLVMATDKPIGKGVILGLFFVFILFYVTIILLTELAYQKVKKLINSEVILLIFFIVDLILLRILDHYTGFPAVLKQSFLFIASEGTISGLSTSGDILLNALIICVLALKIKSYIDVTKTGNNQKKQPFKLVMLAIFLSVLTWILYYAIYTGLQTIGYNAFFGIQLLTWQGIIILIGVLLLILSLYFVTSSLVKGIGKFKKPVIIYLFFSLLIGILLYFFFPDMRIISIAAIVCVFGMVLIGFYLPGSPKTQPLKLMLIVVLLSSTTTVVVNRMKKDKKDVHQVRTVQLLTHSQDEALESHYAKVVEQINNDEVVEDIILNYLDPEENLSSYFQGTYFAELKDKYSIQVFVCEENETLVENPGGDEYDCEEYFDYIMQVQGLPTPTTGLYRIDLNPETIYYIGKLTINSASESDQSWKLFIEFFYSYVPEGLGYTELLVDNSNVNLDLTNYSFAVYENGMLNNKFGDFDYHTRFDFLEKYPYGTFFNLQGSRHNMTEFGKDKFLIVSRPLEKPSERIVVFSALFLLLLLLVFLYFSTFLFSGSESLIQLSFRNRLQLIFISTISFIIAMLAVITLYYAEANNESRITEHLKEKAISVLIELEHKLLNVESLEHVDQEELQEMLVKFSQVFFSDINLYSPSGQLIATSRRDIFIKGLLSENINPMAYEELFVKNKLYYITTENIGTASYYSSYVTLNLNNNQAVGILNLPYFAKQSEVARSYYLMLFTFINMFVLLGIAGTLLALLLSRVLTRPLLLLQKSLGSLQIDKDNERLEWDKNDEIGQLISEYNRMVDKLEQSAELLKHSERESAWREVAQQIAHEIKNPLTPMKLNVQYLEKAYLSDDLNTKDKISSISSSLISQIDSLNQVAEMFSNFAKTNAGNLETVNLEEVVHAAVDLFRNQQGINITVQKKDEAESFVTLGVEKDLLRVFNNLIKNAIQSMEDNPTKVIEISLEKKEGFILVLVSDQGKGIPSDAKQNIFQPYFTTKSGGTGLGLAIARNIMNEIGGEISYENKPSGGTTFALYFRQLP